MPDFLKQIPGWLRSLIVFPLLFLNGWLLFQLIGYLQPIVNNIITAALIAFVINFPIRFLEKNKIPRYRAIGLVLVFFLVFLIVITVAILPSIIQQLTELATHLPQYIQSGNQALEKLQNWATSKNIPVDFSGLLVQATQKFSNQIQALSQQILSFFLVTVNSLLNIVFILVLAIFLVLTGENVWDGIFSWLPQPWDKQLRELIYKTFSNYFATQAILAGILSVAQTIVFVLLGIPYSLLFGFTIGLTTLIPYASGLTIIVISLIITFRDFFLGMKLLAAAIIVGQINDNIIAPRLMGNMIGLNPFWLIVVLVIGGKIGGILGLLLAVPVASVIKTVVDSLRDVSSLKTQENILPEAEIILEDELSP